MRMVLQNTGVFFLVSIMLGDVVSASTMGAALPSVLAESGYSRGFENKADEGAALILVQPALPCLDVIRDARENFSVPIAAYHVSGESAMIRAAGERGFLDAQTVMMESLVCIKRAGADMIITYSALEAIEAL